MHENVAEKLLRLEALVERKVERKCVFEKSLGGFEEISENEENDIDGDEDLCGVELLCHWAIVRISYC